MNPGLKYFIRENQHVKHEVKHEFTYIDTSWAVPTMHIIDSVEYPKRSPRKHLRSGHDLVTMPLIDSVEYPQKKRCEKRLGSGHVEVDTGDGGQRVKQQ
jgi:hypothetical protein